MPRCHDDLVPVCHGAKVPRCLGAMVPWRHGALVPRCHGALVPWFHAAMVPWRHDAKLPWCHGSAVPQCRGAMVPRCTDIQLEKDTTMAGYYMSVGVCHWRRLKHCTDGKKTSNGGMPPCTEVVLGTSRSTYAALRIAENLQLQCHCFFAKGPLISFPLFVPVLSWLFDALGRPPKEPFPVRPQWHAATRTHRGSSSSSPPIANGFGTGTPVPSPQSQSFSQSYGSIVPTSLSYIIPSTRGYSPWRPDAVISTTRRGRHSVLRIFKGHQERTKHHAMCGALLATRPYLRLSRFLVPRRLGAMVPWCLGALVPWCHGATVLSCLGSMVPWCLGAMVPRCHGAMVPRCTDILLDKDNTTAGH
ncbi:hypothetical protein CQW23_09935 [Capsicum baccatum]|uniref:Protein TAR1 n=1 Tax=Capsicum baccatum TaxID=33114 RepID=A0A2G2WY77_CAPBA|nr:hypothetical protein CQW23_09935 [Capsicum baccatum]